MLKKTKLELSGRCPKCGETFFLHEREAPEIFTMNCNQCGELLSVEGEDIFIFNEVMHERIPKWPKDGENTGVLDTIVRKS